MSKKVLVTGGTKGIGYETVKKLKELGFQVTVVGRNFSEFDIEGVKKVTFDLEKVDELDKLFDEVGEIDVLVNNAGIDRQRTYDDYPNEDIEKIVNVNLKTPVKLITLFADSLIKNNGRVINVASQAAEIGHKDIWYGITKAGLVNATKSFAGILGPQGVKLNAVAPGPVETTMIEDSVYSERFEKLKERTILNRIAKPEEIADVIVWLAKDAPEYFNGETIDLNNGAQRIK